MVQVLVSNAFLGDFYEKLVEFIENSRIERLQGNNIVEILDEYDEIERENGVQVVVFR